MYAPQGLLSGLYDEYRTRCSITMSLQTYAIEQSGRHERSTGVQGLVCCRRLDDASHSQAARFVVSR